MTIKEAAFLIMKSLYDFELESSEDGFVAGDPERELQGVATTFLASCEVIEGAACEGCNLLIVHEPVYYGSYGETDTGYSDRIVRAKTEILREKGICVLRLHDYKHRKKLDPVLHAFTSKLGWEPYRNSTDHRLFLLPGLRLSEILGDIKNRLELECLRYIGDENSICRKAGIMVGAPGGVKQMRFMDEHDLDFLLCGEINEWELPEYVRDSNFFGFKRSVAVTGHEQSEKDAMELLAGRIGNILTGYKVKYLGSSDRYSLKFYC